MSADLLRRAASLMRERADAARFGEWTTTGATVTAPRAWGYEDVARCEGSLPEGNVLNALHIASWHPAVALAVADLLDTAARLEDEGSTPGPLVSGYLLAVARAYLNQPPP